MVTTTICAVIFLVISPTFSVVSARDSELEMITKVTTVEAGKNFSLLCQGKRLSIRWGSPDVPSIYAPYVSGFSEKRNTELIRHPIYQYSSILYVSNATGYHTGFYSCYYLKNNKKQAYVYVKDDRNLCFIGRNERITNVKQYHNVVIPCKPTSPDVRMELFYLSKNGTYVKKKIVLDTIDENGSSYIFNPHEGFRTDDTKTVQTTEYLCKCTRDSLGTYLRYWVIVTGLTTAVPKPLLKDLNDGYNIIQNPLTLECNVERQGNYTIEWITPTNLINVKRMEIQSYNNTRRLSIKQTKEEDRGIYFCKVIDKDGQYNMNHLNVAIYNMTDHFIDLTMTAMSYNILPDHGELFVQWKIKIDSFPRAEVFWTRNQNETIGANISSPKFLTNIDSKSIFLKVKNVSMENFQDYYTLRAKTNYDEKNLTLFVNTTGQPSVRLVITQVYGTIASVQCKVVAEPQPNITLSFKACQDKFCDVVPVDVDNFKVAGEHSFESSVDVNSSLSGYLKCEATNSLGQHYAIQEVAKAPRDIEISEIEAARTIYDDGSLKVEAIPGESITIACDTKSEDHVSSLDWDIPDFLDVPARFYYRIQKSNAIFRIRNAVTIPYVDRLDNGKLFSCTRLSTQWNTYNRMEYNTKYFKLIVKDGSLPTIIDGHLDKYVDKETSLPLQLNCYITGYPTPTVIWFKNNNLIHSNNNFEFHNHNRTLVIRNTKDEDGSIYKCKASNKLGSVERNFKLGISEEFDPLPLWITAMVVLLLAIVAAFIFLRIKQRSHSLLKAKIKLHKEIKMNGMKHFMEGSLDQLSPYYTIDEQASFLPYDPKYEFPFTKLKFGKKLGAGCYGVVMLGEAEGIVEGEDTTTVAIKIAEKSDPRYLMALASELKIMVHVGKHINIVNLLGACTENIVIRELYVILEHCTIGNLQQYILHRQDNFINQINPNTGSFDYSIGKDILSRKYSSADDDPTLESSKSSLFEKDNYTYDENQVITSDNPRLNYVADYKNLHKPICSKDLVIWAFQVSRGMEYLASRRVLHGDLAARNVLLTSNNVVKICDFGLSRTMYYNDTYRKMGDDPLPVRWLSLEALTNRIFSTQSDVWAFGIVLWEFFSLAMTPYPEMSFTDVYNKLREGYRMEPPEFSTNELYEVMRDCWKEEPQSRPSFTELAGRIGYMLEFPVKKHYVELNNPYLEMNNRIIKRETDLLYKVSEPNYQNIMSPRRNGDEESPARRRRIEPYQNNEGPNEHPENDYYVMMSIPTES